MLTTSAGTGRAPLGQKTTNLRTGTVRRVSGGKSGIDPGFTVQKSIARSKSSANSLRHEAALRRRSLRLSVLADATNKAHEDAAPEELEPEHAPPPGIDPPYESDVCPDDLNLTGLAPANLLRGYYNHFYDPVDGDGVRVSDKRLKLSVKQAAEESDKAVEKTFRDMDWDVPESQITRTREQQQAASVARLSKPINGRPTSLATKATSKPPVLSNGQPLGRNPTTSDDVTLPKQIPLSLVDQKSKSNAPKSTNDSRLASSQSARLVRGNTAGIGSENARLVLGANRGRVISSSSTTSGPQPSSPASVSGKAKSSAINGTCATNQPTETQQTVDVEVDQVKTKLMDTTFALPNEEDEFELQLDD